MERVEKRKWEGKRERERERGDRALFMLRRVRNRRRYYTYRLRTFSSRFIDAADNNDDSIKNFIRHMHQQRHT